MASGTCLADDDCLITALEIREVGLARIQAHGGGGSDGDDDRPFARLNHEGEAVVPNRYDGASHNMATRWSDGLGRILGDGSGSRDRRRGLRRRRRRRPCHGRGHDSDDGNGHQ